MKITEEKLNKLLDVYWSLRQAEEAMEELQEATKDQSVLEHREQIVYTCFIEKALQDLSDHKFRIVGLIHEIRHTPKEDW